jgi:hypothetical protein
MGIESIILGPLEDSMFEKVLVPTDLSKYADRMIDCVAEIPGVKKQSF